MSDQLSDAEARRRIKEDTGQNLFVEAGAGSGKTTALVERVTTLVLRDHVRLANIAAVTFTEKAGAELRDRLRGRFEGLWRDPASSSELQERAAEALDDLDSAAIGTLHAFAQRILGLHPIEAKLPPLIEVLDEVASSIAFEERWSSMRRALLDDEKMSAKVLMALSAGVKLDQLRSVARGFGSDWDLIEERIGERQPATASPRSVVHLVEEAARLAARASECSHPDDKFLPDLRALQAWGESLASAVDEQAQYAALLAAAGLRFRYGAKKSWPTDLDGLKGSCRDLQEQAKQAAGEVTEATLRPLAAWIAGEVLNAATLRAEEGKLEFHDLLVLARDVVRRDPAVRQALQQRFQRLLLDEFQDTDPIQIELAVRIAGGRDADAPDWRDVEVPPGSLFVVGDPKQSIYRFRRASIATYLQAQTWFGEDAQVRLSTNFRTGEPILRWVNEVFNRLIDFVPDAQPHYEPLDSAVTHTGDGPPIAVLGGDLHDYPAHGGADRLRCDEASDVAGAIARAMSDQWTVRDPGTGDWRPLRLGDVAVLIPARTSLPSLETALDEAGIAYRAESSSLVYQAPEVRDLLMAARAISDPGDTYACVMTLRSPLFGCGDDDLWTWKRDHGSFSILASQSEAGEDVQSHPVGEGIAYLRRLRQRARWMTPSEVLAALLADRRMLEVAADRPRVRDEWRRLRFVVDQARAWSEVEHGGLRAYLVWAGRQGEESSRVAEAILPETDVDAVRIMTIHGAKGLEFPMVVLSGMSSQPRRQAGVQLLWTPDGFAVRLTKTVQTNDFDIVSPVDEQMDAYERLRLLYVAATRARDHLVVSLHRGQSTIQSGTSAELLVGAHGDSAADVASLEDLTTETPLHRAVAGSPPPLLDLALWLEWIGPVRRATHHVPALSASGLEGTDPDVVFEPADVIVAGAHKGPRDTELPPWKKGRYGGAIGRAVHGVLQVVDLANGQGLDDAVASQCAAEGVGEQAEHIRALAQSALDTDVVRRAAVRPHWRECYAGMVQDDGTVLEGYLDLVYREDDGTLVIVDYKTDDVPEAGLPARSAFYAPQVEAYKTIVGEASAESTDGKLLFASRSS